MSDIDSGIRLSTLSEAFSEDGIDPEKAELLLRYYHVNPERRAQALRAVRRCEMAQPIEAAHRPRNFWLSPKGAIWTTHFACHCDAALLIGVSEHEAEKAGWVKVSAGIAHMPYNRPTAAQLRALKWAGLHPPSRTFERREVDEECAEKLSLFDYRQHLPKKEKELHQ